MEGLTFHVDDLVNGYVDVVQGVIAHGKPVAPRGEQTLECLGATIVVDDVTQTLPLNTGRNLSKAVAAMETLQLIGGFTDPVLTCKASDAFEKVKDGGAFHGAYGPRTAAQFPRVVDRLKADPHSRRAIVTIWDPVQDLFREGLHDYPCTVALEYTIRDGFLVAQTHMRSNDVWLGLAYDAFVFTQVQLTIASILGVPPGKYIHHASSLHIYERDIPKAMDLQKVDRRVRLPVGMETGVSWEDAQFLAYSIVYDDAFWDGSPSRNWYRESLDKVRS